MTTDNRINLIKDRLTQTLTPVHLEIIDKSAQHAGHASAQGGGHFEVKIVCSQFSGCSPLQRHRMVYAAVGDLMNTLIHALSIQAQTPGEYHQQS